MKIFKRVIAILLILLNLNLNSIFGYFVHAKDLEEDGNNIYQDINEEDNTENYTEAYKEYLALSDEEKSNVEVIPNKYNVPLDMIYEDIEIVKNNSHNEGLSGLSSSFKVQSKNAEEIPEQFNLADKIDFNVENQLFEGNCWDFASIKSLETYLKLHDFGTFDFSEKHLAYIESEEFAILNLAGKYHEYGGGGGFELFEDYLNNYYGPVLEEEVPYEQKYTVDDYEYFLSLKPRAYVGETITFPTLDKYNNQYSEDELRLYREKVKKHIMENGSLYATVVSPDMDNNKYYNEGTYSAYYPYMYGFGSNLHAVTIIGWNDNFSRENFKEECRPSKDGAYIALNSWGKYFGDNGIYYISYEDCLVETGLSGIVSASTNKDDIIKENPTQTIQFKDKNLYDVCKEKVPSGALASDDNMTLTVNNSIIDNIYYIDASNREITDLTGIDKFTNLQRLNLENNNITNINQLLLLPDLYKIELKNNNISELPQFKNRIDIDLSENPIKDNLQVLKDNDYLTLKLNNIHLKDEDLNILKDIKVLMLELKDNDLQNVSVLGNNEDLFSLSLSGNKNIDISTIPEVSELYISNCNITNLENMACPKEILDVSSNDNLNLSMLPAVNTLDLSHIDAIDSEKLEMIIDGQYKLNNLNLSYTNVTDVSKLGELNSLKNLDLSGNANIQNLKELKQLTSLSLEHCNITEYKDLYKELLVNTNISILDLKHNEITEIYDPENDIYDNNTDNDDDDNIFDDIVIFGSSPNIQTSKKDATQSVNDIDNNRKILVDLQYNHILHTGKKIPEYVSSIENQKVERNINILANEENRFKDLGEMLSKFHKYKGESINLEGCELDYNKKELIIKSNEKFGTAKISIKGGKYNGFECIINYNTVPTLTVLDIEITEKANKNTYLVGNDFDKEGLVVNVIYENGIYEEIEDYIILNKDNLNNNQDKVIIKYGEIEKDYPIKVYAKEQVSTLDLSDMNDTLFNEIVDKIIKNENYYIESDNQTKQITLVKTFFDERINLYLNNSEVDDLTGISKIYNITDFSIDGGRCSDITEIGKLENLETLRIRNNRVNITNIDALNNCNKLWYLEINNAKIDDLGILNNLKLDTLLITNSKFLYLPNINSLYNNKNLNNIVLQNTLTEEDLKTENGKIILPTYIKDLKEQGNTIKAYINYEKLNENSIKADRQQATDIEELGNNLVIELDKEFNENKKQTERYVYIEISGNKISQFGEKSYLRIDYAIPNEVENCNHDFENGVCKKCGEKLLINETEYTINESYLKEINPNTKLENINLQINNKFKLFLIDQGREVKDGIAKTGMIARILEDDKTIAEYTLVVKGDTTGDGHADIKDILSMNKHRLNKAKLENEYFKAGDINKDGTVDIKDILQVNKFRLGKISSL